MNQINIAVLVLALVLLLIITPSTTIVFARHHGGGTSTSGGSGGDYSTGLDAGASAAQSDNPDFDNTKSVSDCMNQGTTYSLAYCQGFIKGYYDTENSLSPSPSTQPPQQFNGGRGQSHTGLVAQVCNFAVNHPGLAKAAAVLLGYPTLDTAVQALCILR
jgi:hypothetical protein